MLYGRKMCFLMISVTSPGNAGTIPTKDGMFCGGVDVSLSALIYFEDGLFEKQREE